VISAATSSRRPLRIVLFLCLVVGAVVGQRVKVVLAKALEEEEEE